MVALAAAYALALQAILLAAAIVPAAARDVAATPLCGSFAHGRSAPAGHARDCLGDCLGTCLSGGCCGAAPSAGSASLPVHAAEFDAPTPASVLTPARRPRSDRAHRSRAPPAA